MEISFRTVKGMLLKEQQVIYDQTYVEMRTKFYARDNQLGMLSNGHDANVAKIEEATTWEELDDAVSFCGYRMSLQEWLNSY